MNRIRRVLRLSALIVLALLVVFGVLVGVAIGPYFFVNFQYDELQASDPKTRAELEDTLFYTHHEAITKQQSDWGRHLSLQGGHFERYSVFSQPIDVVYSGDRVIMILPSFE